MSIPVFEIGPVDQNVVYAFVAGFLIAWLIFGIRILVLKSRAKREVRDLKASLMNRIELETDSIDRIKKEIEELKKKNSNLNISIHNLSEKPGRKEKLQLQVYQSAIEKMSVRAPGFAPAWHVVLKECEEEIGRSLDGTIPFISRMIPAVGTGWVDSSSARTQSSNEIPDSGEITADSELSGKNAGAAGKKLIGRLFGKKSGSS